MKKSRFRRRTFGAVFLTCALGSCTTAPPAQPARDQSLYERLGGKAGPQHGDAHEAMHIRDDEFDALVEDIAKSLDKFKVLAPERAEALRVLNQMKGAIVGH